MTPLANEELREQIKALTEKLEEQAAILRELTAPPLQLAYVVAVHKEDVWVSDGGTPRELSKPSNLKLKVGDLAKVNTKTHQIVGKAEEDFLGGPVLIIKSVTNHHPEVDVGGTGMTLMGSKVTVEAGDRVVVDKSGHIVLENLGKDEARFTFTEELNVTWEDIGGAKRAKEMLIETVEYPLLYGPLYKHYNKKPIKGVQLAGPPGCGKTLLAKALTAAIAQHYGTSARSGGYIYCKGPEVLSKWVGEAERTIRGLFEQAKAYKKQHGHPAVLFIDEADAILGRRGMGLSSDVERTIVPSFLAEMDGLSESGALVILATNRPETLDPAVVRDGRIDRRVIVPRPNQEDAVEIFHVHMRNTPLVKGWLPATAEKEVAEELFSHNYKLLKLIRKSTGQVTHVNLSHVVSGAMIAGIVDKATSVAIKSDIATKAKHPQGVSMAHFTHAIAETLTSMARVDHSDDIADLIGDVPRSDVQTVSML